MATEKVRVLERFGFARRVTNIAQSVFDRNKQPESQWATVVARGNDGRPTVAIDGGETVTCHSWAVEAYEEDRVTVVVRNHKAHLLTNETRPSTDDSTAIELDGATNERIGGLEETVDMNKRAADAAAKAAKDAADAAQRDANAALSAADEARKAANATGQYFFHDSSGVHVSTQADDPAGEANVLLNSGGLLFRAASKLLAQLTTSALAFYDGLGNAATNVVAQFTPTSQRIGRDTEGNIVVNPASILFRNASTWLAQLSGGALTFYDGEGNAEAHSTAQYSGDLVRIGKLSQGHMVTDGDGVWLYSQENEQVARFGSDVILGNPDKWNAKMTASSMDFRLAGTTKMSVSQGDSGHGKISFGVDADGFRNMQGMAGSGFSLVDITNMAFGYHLSTRFRIDGSVAYIDVSIDRQRASDPNVYDSVSSARLDAGGLKVNDRRVPDVQFGHVGSDGGVQAGEWRDYSISFEEYDTPPIVVAGFVSDSTAAAFGRCSCSVHSITTTGAEIRVFNGDTTTRKPSLEWMASGYHTN